MAYKIVWSPEAIKSFERIIQYFAENFSKKEVNSFLDTIERRLEEIFDGFN